MLVFSVIKTYPTVVYQLVKVLRVICFYIPIHFIFTSTIACFFILVTSGGGTCHTLNNAYFTLMFFLLKENLFEPT